MEYELERLGSENFEHVCQALCVHVLGAAVGVFGQGPDGGREATYDGRATWSESETWNGYIVVQAKYRVERLGTAPDQQWFLDQVRRELERWKDPQSNRRKQGRLPEYLLLATNVRLSAAIGGGVDRADGLLASYAADLGLKGWVVWHREQISRMLDNARSIRTAYSALLTPGDIFAQMQEMLGYADPDLPRELAKHVAKDLIAERIVRLSHPGSGAAERLSLEDVAIDLPARRSGKGGGFRNVPAVSYLLRHGEQVLSPPHLRPESTPHAVIVGDPGQGKTTLAQLLTQAYRVALLESAESARRDPAVARVSTATRSTLDDLGLPRPSNRRWPMRVDLASYGEAISGGEDVTVLRWLATQITRRAPVQITAAHLNRWLQDWPWLLVLDGLDEIPSLEVRDRLHTQINDFLIDAGDANADLFVVVTTRPQGYDSPLDPQRFEQLRLQPLAEPMATTYARRLADIRHHDDDEMHQSVLTRMADASKEPITARLMTTPLQVTIVFLLMESSARAPRTRHDLFNGYFDTIYAREVAKPGSLSALLDTHRADVLALHQQVGLQLQILSEDSTHADATLDRSVVEELAVTRFAAEGHDTPTATKLADDLVTAAMNRLVLLVPKGEAAVGFDVRSLQEFMAARAICDGPDDLIVDRMRVIAPAVHWRNTWQLAVGRVFGQREHLRAQVLGLLRDLDTQNGDMLSLVAPIGPTLALSLLADDLAARSPQYRRQLLKEGLELLRHPPMLGDLDDVARLLNRLTAEDTVSYRVVSRELDRAAAGPPDSCASGYALMMALTRGLTGPLATKARQAVRSIRDRASVEQAVALTVWSDGRSLLLSERDPAIPTDSRERRLRHFLETLLQAAQLPEASRARAAALMSDLGQAPPVLTLPPDHETCLPPVMTISSTAIASALEDDALADALADAILAIPSKSWAVTAHVIGLVRGARERRPVGPDLLAREAR